MQYSKFSLAEVRKEHFEEHEHEHRSTKAHAILGSEDDVLLRPHLDSVEIP